MAGKSPDVLVVGGGVIGCAIAYELAKNGAAVQLVEQHHLCYGATNASAGMVAPLSDTPVGHPLIELGMCSFRMYDAFLQEVEEAGGFSIECMPSGILRIARTEEEEQELRDLPRRAAQQGLSVQWLGPKEALEMEPLLAPGIRGAACSPGEPQLSPWRYVEALRRAALAHGATFREGTPVTGLTRNGSRVHGVRTPDDIIAAGTVVLAMGSWGWYAGEWLGLTVPVFPVRGQVVYVNKLSRPLRHTVSHHDAYAVPKGDGTTLVGTTREQAGYDQRNTVAGVAGILTRIQDLLPAMADASINHTRAGLRPASADELPILGPAPTLDGVVLATGHGRSGILLAPATARIIADVVLKGTGATDLGPYSAARLERGPA